MNLINLNLGKSFRYRYVKQILAKMNVLTKTATAIMALFYLHAPVWGQSGQCVKILKEAQQKFDNGRIDLIEGMLNTCLVGNNLSKEDKITAYKLLVNTNLYYNENEKAVEAMTQFLSLNPEYQVDELIDPAEFRNLYYAFRTTPIYLLGGVAGPNTITNNVIRNFSLDNSALKREEASYNLRPGFQIGISSEFPIIATPLSIHPEFYFTVKSYAYKDLILDFASVELQETQAWFETPVTLRYNFNNGKKTVPYVDLGVSMQYLLGAKHKILRKDAVISEGEQIQREVPEASIGIIEQRNRLNYAAVAGIGTKFKNVLGMGYLTLDFKFSYGLTNVVNPKERISNKQLIYDYLHVDNDFSQDTYAFTIGYILPKYKPKLLKRRVKKMERKKNKKKNSTE